jgi:hypothetical protein
MLFGVTIRLGSLMTIFGPLWAGAVYDHVMVGAPYLKGTIILVSQVLGCCGRLERILKWLEIRHRTPGMK